MSDLVFENVAYSSINYGIYANEEGTKFIKNMKGGCYQFAIGIR